MMSAGKPDQAAPRGGAERPQEQDDKSKQQGAGPRGGYGQQGAYGPQGPWGGPGAYGMPPWGMPPGGPGPYGMYGYGMPPGGLQGMAHDYGPWGPCQPPGAGSSPSPWSWMAWFMPWLGPWWSWLSSWFVWPGSAWMLPPFSPFPPFPPGADPGQTLRFAETRAAFWRHWYEAQADIFRQAANYCSVPGCAPTPPMAQVDIAQLQEALKALPEPQAALVIHAVQILQAWDGMRAQSRPGPDW